MKPKRESCFAESDGCSRPLQSVESALEKNFEQRAFAGWIAERGGDLTLAKQLTVVLDNKRGALAEICSKLAERAVNILGLWVPDQKGKAPVRIVVNRAEAAKRVFDEIGVKYSEEEVVAAHLSDRPGALGKLTRKLADHNVDVKYAYGTISRGAKRALIILAVSDADAAAKVVK